VDALLLPRAPALSAHCGALLLAACAPSPSTQVAAAPIDASVLDGALGAATDSGRPDAAVLDGEADASACPSSLASSCCEYGACPVPITWTAITTCGSTVETFQFYVGWKGFDIAAKEPSDVQAFYFYSESTGDLVAFGVEGSPGDGGPSSFSCAAGPPEFDMSAYLPPGGEVVSCTPGDASASYPDWCTLDGGFP
jgi:hypothetical protein